MSSSVSVLVVERLSGIIASAMFAVAALFLGFSAIGGKSIIVPVVIFLALSIIIFFLILNPKIFGLKKLAKKIKFLSKLFEKLINVYNTFLSFKKYKLVIIKVLFYSLTLQLALHYTNKWLEIRPKSKYLFCSSNGSKLFVDYIQKMVKRYSLKVDSIKDIHPHCLRHSIATIWLKEGKPMNWLKRRRTKENISILIVKRKQ